MTYVWRVKNANCQGAAKKVEKSEGKGRCAHPQRCIYQYLHMSFFLVFGYSWRWTGRMRGQTSGMNIDSAETGQRQEGEVTWREPTRVLLLLESFLRFDSTLSNSIPTLKFIPPKDKSGTHRMAEHAAQASAGQNPIETKLSPSINIQAMDQERSAKTFASTPNPKQTFYRRCVYEYVIRVHNAFGVESRCYFH